MDVSVLVLIFIYIFFNFFFCYYQKIQLLLWKKSERKLVWFQGNLQSNLVDCTLHQSLFCWMFRLEVLYSMREHPAQHPRWRLTLLHPRDLQVAHVSAFYFHSTSLHTGNLLYRAKRLFLSFSNFSVKQVSCPSDLWQ